MNIYHENFTFLLQGLRSESAAQQCRSSRDPNEIAMIDFELQYCLKNRASSGRGVGSNWMILGISQLQSQLLFLNVQMFQCFVVQTFKCSNIQMVKRSNVENVHMHRDSSGRGVRSNW